MLILRRRYEWWILMPALHRIGAIVIPATDQLLQADIEYRTNAADVKMIISYDNPHIQAEIEKAMEKGLTSGRGPTGVAAAALYIASVLLGDRKTQRDVAEIAGVTEVTIRNRYKELTEQLEMGVTL